MKKRITAITLLLLFLTASQQMVNGQSRIKENFDFDWQFHLGDDTNAMKPDFKPSGWIWEEIQVPHDWSIKQSFDRSIGGAAGYLPGGIGLYRKEFNIPSSYKGKNVSIIFDGIYHQATIYVNGKEIGYHRYGYTSFTYDLTPYLNYGRKNVLFVRVDRQEVSRWYTGSGIYRHVWLQVTDPVHVAPWGTYVTTPSVSEQAADINIVTTVVNNSNKDSDLQIVQTLLDGNRKSVKIGSKKVESINRITIKANDTIDISQALKISNPNLWSLDTPNRYFMETTIRSGNKTVDTYVTPFGIRYFKFDKDKGFFLNGNHIKLKGVNLHQDAGVLGVAVPDRSVERRLQMLKEFGCNAIRSSHNPPSPAFLEMCDTLGFFVIDEAFDKWKSGYYEKFFDVSWEKDMRDMIVRDRNHPSIFMWSIGNEVSEAYNPQVGSQRAAMLHRFVKELEPTRPTTMAIQNGACDEITKEVDIIGYNYIEPRMLLDKKKYPEHTFYVSEAYPYYSSINPKNHRSYVRINPWNYVKDHDFILGSFIWAGVDYIGESSGWPSKGWTCSPFDICMFERPAAAYHRTVWKDEPIVKLAVVDPSLDIAAGKDHWQYPLMADHWNFPYDDARIMEIHTMTNCDSVRLIAPHAGKQVDYGIRAAKDHANNTVVWYQPFRKGLIEAIGYRNGVEVCGDSLITSKATTSLRLLPDRVVMKADGQDLSHITVQLYDEDGLPVQTDNRKLKVTVEGDGRFLGIDNGDLRREGSFTGNELSTYFGKALIIVQSTRKAGSIRVRVDMEGVWEPYYMTLTSRSDK